MALNQTTRSWHFPLVAAICSGVPALTGAYAGRLDLGILGCIGSLVILYMRPTSISRRMVTLAVVSMGFSASFALAVCASFNGYASAMVLLFISLLATFITRYYVLPPPGSFFFIMIAAIASTLPFDMTLVPMRVGLVTLGGLSSCVIAFFYSLVVHEPAQAAPANPPEPRIYAVFLEASVIGLFIGGSYCLALLIGLDNPYWVPISCAAILQGASFRLVWQRNLHRIFGTLIGMGLTWLLFSLHMNIWTVVLTILTLNFIIELLVVRNYGLAVIFITPLTLLFADATSLAMNTDALIKARLLDTVIGSSIGFLGGWIIHHPKAFTWAEHRLKAMLRR